MGEGAQGRGPGSLGKGQYVLKIGLVGTDQAFVDIYDKGFYRAMGTGGNMYLSIGISDQLYRIGQDVEKTPLAIGNPQCAFQAHEKLYVIFPAFNNKGFPRLSRFCTIAIIDLFG